MQTKEILTPCGRVTRQTARSRYAGQQGMLLLVPGARALCVLAALAGSALAGCGDDSAQRWNVPLQGVDGASVRGEALLVFEDDQLDVWVQAQGLAGNRIHDLALRRGTCAAPGEVTMALRPSPTVPASGRLDLHMIYLQPDRDVGGQRSPVAFEFDRDRVLPLDGQVLVVYGAEGERRYRPRAPVACGAVSAAGNGGDSGFNERGDTTPSSK